MVTTVIVKADVVELIGFRLLVAGVSSQVYLLGLQRTEKSSPSRRCTSSSPDVNGWAQCDVAAARPGNRMCSAGWHDPSAAVPRFAAVGEPQPSPARRVPGPAASDGASPNLEHDGQIQPGLGRPHVGHFRDPVPISAIRGELQSK